MRSDLDLLTCENDQIAIIQECVLWHETVVDIDQRLARAVEAVGLREPAVLTAPHRSRTRAHLSWLWHVAQCDHTLRI